MDKLVWLLTFVVVISLLTHTALNLQKAVVVGMQETENSTVEILFTGDVMLGRTVMTKSMDVDDYTYPFKLVADELRSADITFINLENPIIENCPRHYNGFIFCASPQMIEGMTHAGVDIVNLANNHSLNYGNKGLNETLLHLDEANILHTGVGSLTIKQLNNTTFGFLGFDKSQQESPVFSDEETALIRQSRNEVDVLIVSMHWGFEYQSEAHSSQRQLAEKLVELGADVVVGHHPHWVQNTEYIHGVPVYYSLGNFIFDQMFENEVREGLVIRLTFKGNRIINKERLPVYMENWGQPKWEITS